MKYLFETIIEEAVNRKISDIHISENEKVLVQFRYKGDLSNYQTLEKEEGSRLMHYILFMAHLSLDHKMNLNTGIFTYRIQGNLYRLRVSSIPTLSGNHLVIRLLDHEIFHHLEQLTKDNRIIEYLKKIIEMDHGLVLISGPTGAGKTTTLNVILQEIYKKRKANIITIEDPIEMINPTFTQIQISKKINYETALRQILRHDPDVVMIGELRDEYSAALAVRSALTGTLVIATVHSNNAFSTLKRIENLKISNDDLNEILQVVLSQRLYHTADFSSAYYEYYDHQNHYLYTFEESKQAVQLYENNVRTD